MLVPAKVILNGLDDKVCKVSDEYDIKEISLYHKARKQETLQKLFPTSGAIEIHYLSNRFIKIPSQDSIKYLTSFSPQKHCKELWKDFMKMMLILFDMGLECDENSISSIHYRQISSITRSFEFKDMEEFVANF